MGGGGVNGLSEPMQSPPMGRRADQAVEHCCGKVHWTIEVCHLMLVAGKGIKPGMDFNDRLARA